jgi:hypothetical protein
VFSGSRQELALADLACSLGHIHFTLHPCRWTNHPHGTKTIHRNQGATRHPRRCNGTNGNGKEEEVITILAAIKRGSPTLWEEHRLRVFENRVLRRIFGPESDAVTG